MQRYSVVPLSPNSGLISWVANCDTLHALIKEYRDARKASLIILTLLNYDDDAADDDDHHHEDDHDVQAVLNVEHRLMLQLAPNYDGLPVLNKLEAFEYALQRTDGQDVAKVICHSPGHSHQ